MQGNWSPNWQNILSWKWGSLDGTEQESEAKSSNSQASVLPGHLMRHHVRQRVRMQFSMREKEPKGKFWQGPITGSASVMSLRTEGREGEEMRCLMKIRFLLLLCVCVCTVPLYPCMILSYPLKLRKFTEIYLTVGFYFFYLSWLSEPLQFAKSCLFLGKDVFFFSYFHCFSSLSCFEYCCPLILLELTVLIFSKSMIPSTIKFNSISEIL